MAHKYVPDLMWVVRRPIKDLEKKVLPELDSSLILSEEARGSI
jgi:hypothetical protein